MKVKDLIALLSGLDPELTVHTTALRPLTPEEVRVDQLPFSTPYKVFVDKTTPIVRIGDV